jgi:transglutaminase-like putative cysteine protease
LLDRRNFLKSAVSVAAAGVGAQPASADPLAFSNPGDWRAYEIRTLVEIESSEPTRVWVPAASFADPLWSRPLGTNWTGNSSAELVRDPVYGAEIVRLEWRGSGEHRAEIVSRVATRDRTVDIHAGGGNLSPLSGEERALFTKATALIPTDGIVKDISDRIVAGAGSDLEKAQAIYAWLVANTQRIGATRGCGSGDIRAMLAGSPLGGKCADINGLFVSLARAAGLAARDLYGIRVAPSRFGYKSLGASSADVTKAQHCRADVWLEGLGWTPMDAADVRKVMLEEPPKNLSAEDPEVSAARAALIGGCEGNWIAFNCAHDLALPGSAGAPVGFLMYPQGEVGDTRLDCLEPGAFRYKIVAREIST